MFPHRNIHKYTCTSPDGKTNNQTDHVLIDRRSNSSILDVQSFREADCDTDHYMVIAEVWERLSTRKQIAQTTDVERFNLKKLSESEVRKQFQIELSDRFAGLENLNDSEDINMAWENIKQNIKISVKETLCMDGSSVNRGLMKNVCNF
jgi:hypothetical protein